MEEKENREEGGEEGREESIMTENKKRCFVMMPFGGGDEYPQQTAESSFIFQDIIKPAVIQAYQIYKDELGESGDIDVFRELENSKPGDITQDIIRNIESSDLSIVDLTGKNPNVFYELGVRHARKKIGTILITQDNAETLPFNVRNFKVINYDPRLGGAKRAIEELKGAVRDTLTALNSPRPGTDSLVYGALEDFELKDDTDPQIIGWSENWSRIKDWCEELHNLDSHGLYSPDLLVSLTNGGLFFADTVLRTAYSNRTPLISLWAERSTDTFFDNVINDSIINENIIPELKKRKKDDTKIEILVLDDMVGTGTTFKLLIEYLQKRLGDSFEDINLKFVFLYTAKADQVVALKDHLLRWDDRIATHFQVRLDALTPKIKLPYDKRLQ